MASFSFPERSHKEIASLLHNHGIAAVTPADLNQPTADVMCHVYANFLAYVDPLGEDLDAQMDFEVLQVLDNPEHHMEATQITTLCRKLKLVLAGIQYPHFSLRDMLRPDPKRTLHILSTIINFLFIREEKLNNLQSIMAQYPADERRIDHETKIDELKKEISDHEVACQMEEPVIQEIDAQVKSLKQEIQNYNKKQVDLRTKAKGLNEKLDGIQVKIRQCDVDLFQISSENSNLLSQIVQSPDKLQRVLEEKKAHREEVKNSERLAVQKVHKNTATMEVYSKICQKLSKRLTQMQTILEEVHALKAVDKDVKAFKTKLSEEGVSKISLEAKIDEWREKVMQSVERVRVIEKERDARMIQDSQKHDAIRTDLETKFKNLESREKNLDTVVAKGDANCLEADSVRKAGWAQQAKIQAKMEEIIAAFHDYSKRIAKSLSSVDVVNNAPAD